MDADNPANETKKQPPEVDPELRSENRAATPNTDSQVLGVAGPVSDPGSRAETGT